MNIENDQLGRLNYATAIREKADEVSSCELGEPPHNRMER